MEDSRDHAHVHHRGHVLDTEERSAWHPGGLRERGGPLRGRMGLNTPTRSGDRLGRAAPRAASREGGLLARRAGARRGGRELGSGGSSLGARVTEQPRPCVTRAWARRRELGQGAPGDGQSLCAQPIGRNGSRGPQPPGTRTCRRGCPQGGSSLDFQRVAGNPVRVDGGACASEGARGGRPGHSCPRPPGAGKPRETVGPVADSPWDLLPGAVPSV